MRTVDGADVSEQLPGVSRPVISHPRRTSVEIHDHLRRLILEGVLPVGSELRQAELARRFEVSRTPLREAFRMLQEEGLIDADINHRARVAGLDAADLDCLYAARIALESVGVRLSAGRLTRSEVQEASAQLHDMDRAEVGGDPPAWHEAHRMFHRLLVVRCTPSVLRTITSYAERSERYVRAAQARRPDAFVRRRQEHYDLFTAVVAGQAERAARLSARHLARTAGWVLGDLAPDRASHDVAQALAMVCGPEAVPDGEAA
ncbi:GntR family transcriptional regulator [Streptomyces sp. WI04-05B]|uniref:GntR family transcriptional regulator n=1 Tax=Streptomyces TaxID=1883 RepID=UPI0029B22DCB|nr:MULTISPECIES: GntR family transcriptional regulator [unclassified Streptomyces]MDX2546983.1 GntR family transcriptional regulator [Streptomyces sp. WI04-05B]MDX2589367.1 GntR family transcriptional regulator [Streptomyces sp. WI04-05A]MDX3748151.1 GntR family transcriptional regulator [Streptomyces sp. AK08-02]